MCVAMGYLGRQRSYRQEAPPSSGRRLSLQDEDPRSQGQDYSRHGSLLAAAGIGNESSQPRSTSRRSPAAHTKRTMSRARLAEEKIRLLDGIGGYSPPWGAPVRQDGGYSWRTRWCSKHAPSAGQAVVVVVLVAAVVALASHPETVTSASRYALTSLMAKTIAARDRVSPGDTTATTESSLSVEQSKWTAKHSLDASPLAAFDEKCIRLIAGETPLASELITLVHAATHFRETGKSVVWDYQGAAATCQCGEVDLKLSQDEPETEVEGSRSRRLLRETKGLGETTRSGENKHQRNAKEACTRASTNNGWSSLFDSDSEKIASPTTGADECASVDARATANALSGLDTKDGGMDSRLKLGAGNALCDDLLSAWVLGPAMESELNSEIEKLGGDLRRVVAFHVGDGAGGFNSDRYDADIGKEVARVRHFIVEKEELPEAAKEGWSTRAAAYEARARASDAETPRKTKAEQTVTKSEQTDTSSESSQVKTKSKLVEAKEKAWSETNDGVRAYVASAIKDMAVGQKQASAQKEKVVSEKPKLAKSPRDEPTLMDQFSSWLKKRNGDGDGRRLLGVTTDADAGVVAAAKLMDAGAVFESATDKRPVSLEDLSLLQRVGRRFETFKAELLEAKSARADDPGMRLRKAQAKKETEKAAAAVVAEIEAAAATTEPPLSVELLGDETSTGDAIAKLSGHNGWRCVLLGTDTAAARLVASAIESAHVPCVVVDRVSTREQGSRKEKFASRSEKTRCANTVADVVDAELTARARRATVRAPTDGARLAALLQQCREDRLDMTDWAGLGVHELSVSSARDADDA